MKHRWILGLLLVGLLLPLCARAETWANFVKTVNAATKGAEGEVVVVAPEHVEAYKKKTDALRVPDGVSLVIEGGQFESMALGGGDITLRAVQVLAEKQDQTAIYIPSNQSKPMSLKLTIDPDTVIQSTAVEGDGIGTWDKFSEDAIIDITNYGTIASDQAVGVLIRIQAQGKKDASIKMHNFGTVTGGKQGIFLAADTVNGAGDVWLHNEGEARSKESNGIGVRGQTAKGSAKVHVENATDGLIVSDWDYGLKMTMYDSRRDEDEEPAGIIVNDGVISGTDGAIHLTTLPLTPVPIRLRSPGTLVNSRDDTKIVYAEFRMELSKKTDKAPEEEAFLEAVTPWLTQLGIDYLPEGTTLYLDMYAWRKNEWTSPQYGQSLGGMGIEITDTEPVPILNK